VCIAFTLFARFASEMASLVSSVADDGKAAPSRRVLEMFRASVKRINEMVAALAGGNRDVFGKDRAADFCSDATNDLSQQVLTALDVGVPNIGEVITRLGVIAGMQIRFGSVELNQVQYGHCIEAAKILACLSPSWRNALFAALASLAAANYPAPTHLHIWEQCTMFATAVLGELPDKDDADDNPHTLETILAALPSAIEALHTFDPAP
jgi:hypothetical protein